MSNTAATVGLLLLATGAGVALPPAPVIETVRFAPVAVRIVDADTIAHPSMSIRLKGVAAPESGHPAYWPGRAYLDRLRRRAVEVTCRLTNERTYDRRVGRCVFTMPDGAQVDIQRAAIGAGYARGCSRFGGWRYFLDETVDSARLPLPRYCRGLSVW